MFVRIQVFLLSFRDQKDNLHITINFVLNNFPCLQMDFFCTMNEIDKCSYARKNILLDIDIMNMYHIITLYTISSLDNLFLLHT